jgi:hypothetical protein
MIALVTHNDRQGYAHRLEVELAKLGEVVITDCDKHHQDDVSNRTRELVYQVASRLLIDFSGARCTLPPLWGAPRATYLSDGSLYAPMSMAVIKLGAERLPRDRDGDLRCQLSTQLEAIRSSNLSTVAATAQGDSFGDFEPAKGIDLKLGRLMEHPDQVAFCVMAKGQKMDDGKTPEQFLSEGHVDSISVIYAADPIDALVQVHKRQKNSECDLFDRRCRALARRIV